MGAPRHPFRKRETSSGTAAAREVLRSAATLRSVGRTRNAEACADFLEHLQPVVGHFGRETPTRSCIVGGKGEEQASLPKTSLTPTGGASETVRHADRHES